MPSPRFQPFLSRTRIERTVRELAGQVDRYARANRISEFCLVCVMDGAFIFCADLARAIETPASIVFVKASSYDGTRSGRLRLSPLPGSIRGRAVLVVDTIYDTGKTVAKVLQEVRKLTTQVSLVLLVEKQGKAAVAPGAAAVETFVGFRIQGDPFLVGYGLDVSGRFRDLPDIRIYSSR